MPADPPPKPASTPALELTGLRKSFGADTVVDQLTLTVHAGEFFSLLGPSGCGKTTTLRLVAGLETTDPGGGEIRIHGIQANQLKPYQRGVGMVFQSYALFPHLSVIRNVAFGLEQQKVSAQEIGPRVAEALALVRLDPHQFGRRMPSQLSGGQRQRVALARALVLRPKILLLDEPLGALDLQLRRAMQVELKSLNRSLGITFVYVTHDQIEALTMSDRIAVMHQGRIAQLGTPAEVYQTPRNAFVASFIGEANLFVGTVSSIAGSEAMVTCQGCEWLVPNGDRLGVGSPVELAIRPEWIRLRRTDDPSVSGNRVTGSIADIGYLGDTLEITVTMAGGSSLKIHASSRDRLDPPFQLGDRVVATWQPADTHLLESA